MNSEFYPGDEIRFLNETGGGIVVKKSKNGFVIVRTEDGFEYPVSEKELVLISRQKEVDKIKKVSPPKEEIIKHIEEVEIEEFELKQDDNIAISLAWVPSDNSEVFDGKLDLFIINDSNYFIFYHLVQTDEYGTNMLDAGKLAPNLKLEIKQFGRDDLNTLKSLQMQVLLFGHRSNVYLPAVDKKFTLKPVKFFNNGNYCENDFFDVPAYSMLVLNNSPVENDIEVESEKIAEILQEEMQENTDKSARYKARPKPETYEVDLHINTLKESVVGMSNSEILEFQMKHFHSKITDAIQNKVSNVVFIHGIGNGTLRDTLRDSLDKQYKLKFQDASFREYGFGATLVIVR